jgi:hypothetical protein
MHLRWAERAVTPFSRLEMVQKWRQITDEKERETGIEPATSRAENQFLMPPRGTVTP